MANVVSIDRMNAGGKGGGKHWTKEEMALRQQAASGMKRAKVRLAMPAWLSGEAQAVWKKVLKDMKGIDLLDNLDADVLAIYCDAVVQHRQATQQISEQGYTVENAKGVEIINPLVQVAQSYARIVAQYAEKLGLTATGRARLAAKKARAEPVDPDDDLFGGRL